MHPPMPVIVGAPRSGTTLLRFMLDAHPELAIPPETGFFVLEMNRPGAPEVDRKAFFDAIVEFPESAPAWQDFGISRDAFRDRLSEEPFSLATGYRTFYRLYAGRLGKPRWGDKAPLHCHYMDRIEAILPEAHFIHIVRDGRDVCMSLRHMWFSPGWDVEVQARHWCDFVTAARRHGAGARRYLEIRYEELILQPERVLRRICDFVELSFSEAMLRYHERTPERLQEHKGRLLRDGSVFMTQAQRIRQQEATTCPPDIERVLAWKSRMDPSERARYEAVAGSLLAQLGYEVERE